MNKKYIVSFPMLGNYDVVIYNLISKVIDTNTTEILMPDKLTSKILEEGALNSPDFVCVSFKYTLGNFISSLEKGANVLIQAGGGCRFGYYAELQEQILKDLGYNFIFISLLDAKKIDMFKVYNKFKLLNNKLSFTKFIYYFTLTIKMVSILDEFEIYLRNNLSFEEKKGSFKKLHNEFLKELTNVNSIKELFKLKKLFL